MLALRRQEYQRADGSPTIATTFVSYWSSRWVIASVLTATGELQHFLAETPQEAAAKAQDWAVEHLGKLVTPGKWVARGVTVVRYQGTPGLQFEKVVVQLDDEHVNQLLALVPSQVPAFLSRRLLPRLEPRSAAILQGWLDDPEIQWLMVPGTAGIVAGFPDENVDPDEWGRLIQELVEFSRSHQRYSGR